MKITYDLLRQNSACLEQLYVFAQLFPDGAELTRENWDKADAGDLNVLWLGRLLCPYLYKEFREASCAAHAKQEKQWAAAAARCAEECVQAEGRYARGWSPLEYQAAVNASCDVRSAAAEAADRVHYAVCKEALFQLLVRQSSIP